MGLLRRLRQLDDSLDVGGRPRRDETRQDFHRRLATRPSAVVPASVYAELVELHDRVARLEARLEAVPDR